MLRMLSHADAVEAARLAACAELQRIMMLSRRKSTSAAANSTDGTVFAGLLLDRAHGRIRTESAGNLVWDGTSFGSQAAIPVEAAPAFCPSQVAPSSIGGAAHSSGTQDRLGDWWHREEACSKATFHQDLFRGRAWRG